MSFTVATSQTSPQYWSFALALCLDRLREGQEALLPFDIENFDRSRAAELKANGFRQAADVHFTLVAIRNVLRILENRLTNVDDARLKKAEQEFRSAFPDAWNLRDILEHLLDYEAGQGTLQKNGEMPADEHLPNLIYRSKTDASAEIVLLFNVLLFNHEKRNIEIKAAAMKALEIAQLMEMIAQGK
jgi:hypothetical protein